MSAASNPTVTHHHSRALSFLAVACVAVSACASGGSGGPSGTASSTTASGQAAGGGAIQTDAEVARIMSGLQATERIVPNADAKLLWEATHGYMERAFPLDEIPAGATTGTPASHQVRTKLIEWVGDGFPHRTRLFTEIRPDTSNVANMRVRVIALMVEAEPQLEQARPGVPLEYNWRLVGSNPRIEETVIDHIMRRYLALVEGKPIPIEDELVVPIKPQGA